MPASTAPAAQKRAGHGREPPVISSDTGSCASNGVSTVPAHRIAYAIEHGLKLSDMPRNLVVRHLCIDPAYRNNCNNPAHLELGSQAENLADMVGHGTKVRGEKHHFGHRYSDELIKTLRERYWCPVGKQPTITELANEQGIAVTVVSRWLQGVLRRDAGGPIGPTDHQEWA